MTEAAAAPLPNIMNATAVRGAAEPRDLLPAAVQEKLDELMDRRDAAHAGLMRIEDERQEARADLQRSAARLSQMEDAAGRSMFRKVTPLPPKDSGGIGQRFETRTVQPPSDEDLVVQRAEVAKLQRRMDRINASYNRASAQFRAIAGPADRIAVYVERRLASGAVKFAEPIQVRLSKGQTAPDAVEAIRTEIADLKASISTVETAPRPSAETKAAARQMVEALAESGRPDLAPSVQHAEAPRWPTTLCENFAGRPLLDLEAARQFDTPGLLAWLLKDRLIAALDAEIDALTDDAAAIATADRPKRVAELKAQALDAELREEAFIVAAEHQGVTIDRRHDIDPRAFLGLTVAAPEPSEW